MTQLFNSKRVRRFAREPIPQGDPVLSTGDGDSFVPVHATRTEEGDRAVAADPAPLMPSKAALVLGLLTRQEGARIDELTAATGWLPHTTRAALTGLRKKGHTIVREKDDGITRYAIKPVVVE